MAIRRTAPARRLAKGTVYRAYSRVFWQRRPQARTAGIQIAQQGGTCALGMAGTGQQTSVEFTRTPYPVTVTPPRTDHPAWRHPNAGQYIRLPAIPIAFQGGTCALGMAGTGQQTSQEFTRTPNPTTVYTPPSIYPSLRQVNARIFARLPAIPIAFQGGTTTLGLAGTGQQTSVEFTQQWRQQITPPGTRHPSVGKPIAPITAKAPPPPADVRSLGGTCTLGLTGTGQQTSVEFTRTPYPVTVTPPATRYPSLGRPNAGIYVRFPAIPISFDQGTAAVGLAATGQAVKVAPQGGTCSLGLTGTGQQTSVEFRRTPNPVVVTPPATRYPSLGKPNAGQVVKAPPPVPVSGEQGTAAVGLATTATEVKVAVVTGTCGLGLAATGQQTSVAFTRAIPVFVQPGRTYPRPLLVPNVRLIAKAPPPPPQTTPEQGPAVVGFATTGTAIKVAKVGGTCSLGVATTGKAAKLAPVAGVISVGISGTCSARKVAPHIGVGSVGAFVTSTAKKLAVERGTGALGFIGRVSSTIVRPVNGTTSLLLLPRFDPFAQLPKPLHAGTDTDLAVRRHAGTEVDAAGRNHAGTAEDVAGPDHAGTSTDAATHHSAGAAQDVVTRVRAGT